MNILVWFDPGNSALLVAATSAFIVALASLGSEALAGALRKLGASARHDAYLGGLLVALISPLIVVAVARSGFVLVQWPLAVEQPAERPAIPRDLTTRPLLPVASPPPALDEVLEIASKTAVVETPRPSSIEPIKAVETTASPVAIAPPKLGSSLDDRRAWAGAVVVAWGLGFAVLLARLLRGMAWLFGLGRRSRPITLERLEGVRPSILKALGSCELPPIFETDGVLGPLAGGLFRPRVVLPSGMIEALSASALRDVLIHECAHISRRDPLIGLLQRVTSLVFWPHPLVHRLNQKLSRAREEACDDLVLREGDPCAYARTLLELAESGGSIVRDGPLVGLFETRWKLEDRVARVLNRRTEPEMNIRATRWVKLTSLGLLALASVAVASVRPGVEAPASAEPPSVEPAEKVVVGRVVEEMPPDDPEKTVLKGSVVSIAKGNPQAVAQAMVRFVTPIRGFRDINVVADAEGRFQVDAHRVVESGLMMAWDREGTVAGYKLVENAADPVEVAVAPASSATGRVLDSSGRPIVGRRVQLVTRITISPTLDFRMDDFITTDDEGRYRFTALIPGTRCEVWVLHDQGQNGSGRLSIEKFNVNGPDPITVVDITIPGDPTALPASVAGPSFVATDLVGINPMPYAITRSDVEALVKLVGREPATPEVLDRVGHALRPQVEWITSLDRIQKLATDPRFIAMADRASNAALGKPADTAVLVHLAFHQRIGKNETSMRDMLASPMVRKSGKPVQGIVEDLATGRPVAGATVFNEVDWTTTKANGEFVLEGSTQRSLWVEAAGCALMDASGLSQPAKVAVVREQPIVGRVLERDGFKPVEGAIVWAMVNHSVFGPEGLSKKNDNYGFPLTARTDAQGRFAFRGMPPGAVLEWFQVRHPRLRGVSEANRTLKAGAIEVLLVEPGCVVSGEVIDELGRGVEGASVAVRGSGGGNVGEEVTTDSTGRYHFGNINPGRYDLVVQPERQAFRSIAVVANTTRPAINQVVVEAGWTIAGKVVDVEGRPIANAYVGWATPIEANGLDNKSKRMDRITCTEEDGTFRLEGFAFGNYRIIASAPKFGGQVKVDATVNRPDLVITIPVGRK